MRVCSVNYFVLFLSQSTFEIHIKFLILTSKESFVKVFCRTRERAERLTSVSSGNEIMITSFTFDIELCFSFLLFNSVSI